MSRPWSLFSSSSGLLREMCMASWISMVVVWLARSRIHVSSQRGWWCLDQACSAIADFSVSPLGCLVLLQMHLQCPLCFPDVLKSTVAGDLVNHSWYFQCRVSVLDPAQFPPESGWSPKASSNTVLSADTPGFLTKAWYIGNAEGVEWLLRHQPVPCLWILPSGRTQGGSSEDSYEASRSLVILIEY